MKNWSTDTESFLKHFTGKQIFVVMDDVSNKPRHQHREYKFAKANLVARNNEHKESIFFTVNELDKEKDPDGIRTTAMFVRARAVFGDDDIKRPGPRDDFDLKPSLIVQSSSSLDGNKYHYYWLISDDCSLEQWNTLQSKLVSHYEFDKGAKDCTRYLRLPGYFHWKDKENPTKVLFIDNNIGYAFDEINSVFGKYSSDNSATLSSAPAKSKFAPEIDDPVFDALNDRGLIIERIGSGIYRLDCPWTDNHSDKIPDGSARYFLAHYNGYDQGNFKCHHSHCQDKTVFSLKQYLGIDEEYQDWSSVDIDNINLIDELNLDIPRPPGDLGLLIDELYGMQIYKNYPVSFITGIGLLAGICGRRFNISGEGLNLWIVLLMPPGRGKDFIQTTIRSILMRCIMPSGLDFIGAQDFTAGKSLLKFVERHRSCVCVITEAGEKMKKVSGDSASLRATCLDIYTKSGYDKSTSSYEYSDEKNSIKPMRATAITLIDESVPESYMRGAFENDNLINGVIMRQSIYKEDGKKPYADLNRNDRLGDYHQEKIQNLVNLCTLANKTDNSDFPCCNADFFYLWEDAIQFSDACTDIENDETGKYSKPQRAAACRMWVKAAKYAALASIYNLKHKLTADSWPNTFPIGEREWIWAKNLVLYELHNAEKVFSGSSFSSGKDDLMRGIVAPIMLRLLKKESKGNKRYRLSDSDFDNKLIPVTILSQMAPDYPQLKYSPLQSDETQGMDDILDYMVKLDYIDIQIGENKGGRPRKYSTKYGKSDKVIIKSRFFDLFK